MALKILNIDTPSLGDRSYLIHDGKTAAVIDPQRDIDRINDLLSAQNLTLGAVVETHIHNDYVSGGLDLSRSHRVPYLINKDDPVVFERSEVSNQQVFPIGTFALKAIHTPGHTYTHLSYALLDHQGEPVGVFTGGSLLHGATGRPDLLGWDHAAELAGLQHHSAKLISEMFKDSVDVYPTHGFGSFCSATPSTADSSNLADEKRSNPVLLNGLEQFIAMTLESLDKYPTYFKYMGPENMAGAQPIDLSELATKSTDEILMAIKSSAWVVDLRNRALWAKEHLVGTASIGIDGSMASYLGWLYPYEKELYLISDNATDISNAQRELARIGIDRPTGSFVGSISDFPDTSSIKVASFKDLSGVLENPGITLLDVRQINERKKSHIEHSIFIPFYEVEARVNELPESGEIWVHCASGYRAASVIGFIESSGRTPVLINEDYSCAASISELTLQFN